MSEGEQFNLYFNNTNNNMDETTKHLLSIRFNEHYGDILRVIDMEDDINYVNNNTEKIHNLNIDPIPNSIPTPPIEENSSGDDTPQDGRYGFRNGGSPVLRKTDDDWEDAHQNTESEYFDSSEYSTDEDDQTRSGGTSSDDSSSPSDYEDDGAKEAPERSEYNTKMVRVFNEETGESESRCISRKSSAARVSRVRNRYAVTSLKSQLTERCRKNLRLIEMIELLQVVVPSMCEDIPEDHKYDLAELNNDDDSITIL